MANLTIKGIAPKVLKRLKADAQRHRRSLNQELIDRLGSSVIGVPLDPEDFLAQVREVRVIPRKGRLTDRVLNRLKTQSRL